jgi:uncharacterized membrane protein HdeD (DUF308 family)
MVKLAIMDAPLALLRENWWAVTLRGIAGVVVGALAFLLPLTSMVALVWLFGAYAFLDGLFNLATVWRRGRTRPWWAMALEGLLGVGAGIVSFVWPGITAIALVYVIAAWAIATGILEIIAAIRLRKEIEGEWLLALSGLFSLALGLVFTMVPEAGVVVLVWSLAAYTVAFGILLIWLSFKLRARHERTLPAAA